MDPAIPITADHCFRPTDCTVNILRFTFGPEKLILYVSTSNQHILLISLRLIVNRFDIPSDIDNTAATSPYDRFAVHPNGTQVSELGYDITQFCFRQSLLYSEATLTTK